jgi:hypothetical protein
MLHPMRKEQVTPRSRAESAHLDTVFWRPGGDQLRAIGFRQIESKG